LYWKASNTLYLGGIDKNTTIFTETGRLSAHGTTPPGTIALTDMHNEGRSRHQVVGLFLGPLVAGLMIFAGPPENLSQEGWMTASMGILMAVWWATEAVPIAVTALLPIVVFPLLGIATIQDTTAPYANKVIYLFLGGFIVAFAMQRWNLHRRIALNVLQHVGGNGRSLVGGFMLASAIISMWVMNTSTTMMLLPIAVSIIAVIHKTVDGLDDHAKESFQYSLLLGVAYGATIGGMATLVGTAPNAMLAAFMQETYGTEIDFSRWMLVGLPLSANDVAAGLANPHAICIQG
jgi:sodium-dependent dicarboxylate transporter 2/3/5